MSGGKSTVEFPVTGMTCAAIRALMGLRAGKARVIRDGKVVRSSGYS
jgi:hypothetical protein